MIHLSYLQLGGCIFYSVGFGIGIGGIIGRKLERRHMTWLYGLDRYTRPLSRLSRLRAPVERRKTLDTPFQALQKHHYSA